EESISSSRIEETMSLELPTELPPSQMIKLGKHWNLRPELALSIMDAVKEVLREIRHPPFNNLARMTANEFDVYQLFNEATMFNPTKTQAVLNEWFPNQGDWDLFFPTMYLLDSTAYYFSEGDPPISFVGLNAEDAKALLELDFEPPPTSDPLSGKWDSPKKVLSKHLVSKMDQMRESQGYTSFIVDSHFESSLLLEAYLSSILSTGTGTDQNTQEDTYQQPDLDP
ncbi:hypothetical protein MJO28_015104, partial [Puccinia striiformis f. sp. tritici]